MSNKIGIIAEDDSDVDVVIELIKKIVPQKVFSVSSYVGHGCGKIRGKCFQWAESLKTKGCSSLILLHDLDDNKLSSLHFELRNSLERCAIPQHIVVIPIQEIEAWLLSDSQAIQKAMHLVNLVPRIANPQFINDPKRRLSEIIYMKSGKTKRYLNTVHNKKIAAEIDLVNIRRCTSYIPLEKFVASYIN
jgi:hypothetical protein